MLNVFTLKNGRLVQQEVVDSQALAGLQPVWVDLESATPRELGWVKARFGLIIPADVLDQDLEESARFYEEEDENQLHLRSDFLISDEERPRNERVAFIIHGSVLFSIHTHDLSVFRLLRLRARRMPGLIENATDVLLALYLTDAEYSAVFSTKSVAYAARPANRPTSMHRRAGCSQIRRPGIRSTRRLSCSRFQRQQAAIRQRVAIARAIEERLAARHGGDRRSDEVQEGKISCLKDSGQSRDLAAKQVGFGSGKTYEACHA